MVLPDNQIERALVISAHPDDVDFGAAGTVAAWTKAGIEVSYVIVTDGDSGGFDPDVPRSEIGPMRQREQRAAAAEVGVTEVTFLGYPDGRLQVSHELRRDLVREIRKARPHRLLCQSPERNYDRIYASHPDHLAAGEASVCAVYPDARNPFAHPELLRDEGLEAWTVPEVWLAADPSVNHYVDVTDTVEAKIAAIQAHASQMPGVTDLERMVRGWLGDNAVRAGFASGRLAEAFRVMPTG